MSETESIDRKSLPSFSNLGYDSLRYKVSYNFLSFLDSVTIVDLLDLDKDAVDRLKCI